MTLRKKIFIIGGLIIGFLLAVILALFTFGNKNKQNGNLFVPEGNQNNTENTDTTKTTDLPPVNNMGPENQVIESKSVTTQTSDELFVKQLSGIFVERFNTYSNRNNNSHITDVSDIVTNNMASWMKSKQIRQDGEYYGVTTKVLATNILVLLKDKAKVSVGVEETTYRGSDQTSIFRTGFVDLSKVSGEWKINGFYWEE